VNTLVGRNPVSYGTGLGFFAYAHRLVLFRSTVPS
jgi:hypothetical protein